MDVVRFKEDDVIVASATRDLWTISGFNDSPANKGNARIDNFTIEQFIRLFNGAHTNMYFHYNEHDWVPIEDLGDAEDDYVNDTYGFKLKDGTYERNVDGDNVIWTYRGQ